MIYTALLILALSGLMHAARTFPPTAADASHAGAALSFGFLLLLAFLAGKIAEWCRLPRLTGYMVAGMVVGPSLLGLVSRPMVHSLGPIQGVAICLIALTAGGELNFARMKPLFRTIRWMIALTVVGCALGCTLGLLVLRSWLPFLAGKELAESAVVCSVLGVSLASMSPAVVIALLNEMRADGALSRTVLGVVVVADLVVVVMFALVASLAQAVLGTATDATQAALHVTWELLGSALAGIGIGIVLTIYLRRVRDGRGLFVLLVCVVMSEVGSRLGLDSLIVGLTAGLFMENVAEVETTKLVHDIESASLPVYIVFFAVAGAALRLDILKQVAIPAALLVIVRTSAIWTGSHAAARRARADPAVVRWGFTGLLPQAGLALALPLLFPRIIPGFAEGAAALVLGIVAINQVLMPVLFRIALVRTGESRSAAAITEHADAASSIPGPRS